jgi:hypothetical protein
VDTRFEMREPPDDPWGGRQPKFDRLVMRDARTFLIEGRLVPSGEPVTVRLGPLRLDTPFWWWSPPPEE